MSPRAKLILGAVAAILLAGGGGAALRTASRSSDAPLATGFSVGGPFTLTANDGSTVTDQTYRGKWLLIYFGYTYCPDACPTSLNEISQAMAKLGAKADQIQPLFITIDPGRDTPETMANYVRAFDPRIIGLTGTPAQIAQVAKEFQVYYERHKTDDGSYLMDHTSLIYVMNPRGQFVRLFPGDMTGERMAQYLRELVSPTS
jgi:protein SCO1